jgi:hypothetical protein
MDMPSNAEEVHKTAKHFQTPLPFWTKWIRTGTVHMVTSYLAFHIYPYPSHQTHAMNNNFAVYAK